MVNPSSAAASTTVLIADPPWRFEQGTTDPTRQIENQYSTMELEAICDLAVERVTNEDAILFLWHPPGMATEAVRVAMAWGFRERSSWVWVKPSIGPGWWGRLRHEHVLICTRGKIPAPAEAARFDSVFEAPRGEQSAKPDVVHLRAEAMFPGMAKIELFARAPRDGWTVLGNEVGTGDIAESLRNAGKVVAPPEEPAPPLDGAGLSVVCPVCLVGKSTPCYEADFDGGGVLVLERAHQVRVETEAASR